MPKSNKKGSTALLGKAIIRQAVQDKKKKRSAGTGFHAADISSSSNPLQSITDVTSLEDFVSSAVLAEREFIAERGALSVVEDRGRRPAIRRAGDVDGEGSGVVRRLRIPRRPAWTSDMTAEELRKREADAFLMWRRDVAVAEMKYGGGTTSMGTTAVTPFEKNVEVWRQLWRVIERSDVLVQIVDARNPLMFYCADVDAYVKEVHPAKHTLLLVNKADYLSAQERYAWASYLTNLGLEFLFFSAKREAFVMEELDKANQAAKARVAATAPQDERYVPFDPDKNTTGRVDLTAGLHPDIGSGAEMEAASVAGKSTVSVKSSSANSFLGRSIANKAGLSEQSKSFLASQLRKALLEEEDEDVTSSDEDETGQTAATSADPHDHNDDSDASADDEDEEAENTAVHEDEPHTAQETAKIVSLEEERFRHTGDLSGLNPEDPLYNKCKVLSRDELVDFLSERYKDIPRGLKFGPADEAARNKLKELREKRRAAMLAAREEEIRRRKIMAARLIEVGLGSQIRFGDAADIEALEKADDEDLKELEEADNQRPPLTVGMVGYPNVGKSSTINALMGATANNHHAKRVAVASTPGKTKHFQTLILNDDITLCDCPGLVFPTFISNREEMVVNGVLPIDQLRDHTGPMRLVCQRVKRAILEDMYGIKLPVPPPPQRQDRQPTIYELLDTFCRARGFMAAAHAGPDHPRGARLLLKDYCEGRILFCHPPPGGWEMWCPTLETQDLDTSAVEQTSSSALDSGVAAKPHKGGRVTLEDNVLLPKAAHRHAPVDDVNPALLVEETAEDEVAEEEDSEGSLVSDEELDMDTLRAFSRKIVIVHEEEDEEEDNLGGADGTQASHAAHGPVDSSKLPKKERGLKRNRRRRKGEGREADPYGTAAAADAATRSYHLAEIAAVSHTGSVPLGSTPADLEGMAADPLTNTGGKPVRPNNATVSKAITARGGAQFVDAVPNRLRGQPVKATR